MNDQEHQELGETIHHMVLVLNRLQSLYAKETGKRYVISGPAPEPELEEDYFETTD